MTPRTIATLLLAAGLPSLAGPPSPSLAEPSLCPTRPVAPLKGGEAQLLVAHAATESRPLWPPDGTKLAFVRTRTGDGDIYVLTLATGELKRLISAAVKQIAVK